MNLFGLDASAHPKLTREEKARYCEKISSVFFFTPEVFNTAAMSTLMVSGLGMLFIAWTVYFNKHLQKHPANLIGSFALIIAVLIYMTPMVYLICPNYIKPDSTANGWDF